MGQNRSRAAVLCGLDHVETLYEDAEPKSIFHGPDDILEPGRREHIGWVRQMRFENGAPDRSSEFNAILHDVIGGNHLIEIHWQFVYLIIPGIYSSTYKDGYFERTKEHFRSLGLDCRVADINVSNSVVGNASKIAELVGRIHRLSHKQVILIGHSKGGCDAVGAVSRHWHNLREKVAGVVTLQAPLGGTPIADDFVETELTGFSEKYMRHALDGQQGIMEELTYERRMRELTEFPFPADLPILTFSSGTQRANSPLAHLAAYCRKEYRIPTDGITASWDADLPASSIRVKFELDWDHANCAFPESHGPGDHVVNEACVMLLIRSSGLSTASGQGHIALTGRADTRQWQSATTVAGGMPGSPAKSVSSFASMVGTNGLPNGARTFAH